jgi:hypothetical protein
MKSPDRKKVCKILMFLLTCLELAAPSPGHSETIKWYCIDKKLIVRDGPGLRGMTGRRYEHPLPGKRSPFSIANPGA